MVTQLIDYKKRMHAHRICIERHAVLEELRQKWYNNKDKPISIMIEVEGKKAYKKYRNSVTQYKIYMKQMHQNDDFTLQTIDTLF